MARASGADVSIGGVEYKLYDPADSDVEPYVHIIEPEYARNTSGTPDSETIRAEVKYWIRDDWSGGEGEKFYDANFPNQYTESNQANPRSPGSIKPAPTVTIQLSQGQV